MRRRGFFKAESRVLSSGRDLRRGVVPLSRSRGPGARAAWRHGGSDARPRVLVVASMDRKSGRRRAVAAFTGNGVERTVADRALLATPLSSGARDDSNSPRPLGRPVPRPFVLLPFTLRDRRPK